MLERRDVKWHEKRAHYSDLFCFTSLNLSWSQSKKQRSGHRHSFHLDHPRTKHFLLPASSQPSGTKSPSASQCSKYVEAHVLCVPWWVLPVAVAEENCCQQGRLGLAAVSSGCDWLYRFPMNGKRNKTHKNSCTFSRYLHNKTRLHHQPSVLTFLFLR